MASAGRLHVSIEARVEKLEEGLARADRKVQQATSRMKSLGDQASSVASRGLRAMAAGMGAASAAAAAHEKQWATLGATILASFAAGGPVAGGIALLGAAVGVLIGNTNEMGKAAEEAGKKWADSMEKARAATKKLDERILEMRLRAGGFGDLDIEALKLNASIEAKRKELEDALRRPGRNGQYSAGESISGLKEELATLEEQRRRLFALADAEAQAQARTAAAADKQASAMERVAAALPAGFGGTGGLTREGWANVEANRLRGMLTPGEPRVGAGRLTGAWDMQEVTVTVDVPKLTVEETPAFETWKTSLGLQISDTIAAGLVDGALRGGKQVQDILARAFENVSGQLLNLGVGSLLQGIAPGLFPAGLKFFQHGATVVDHPTLAWVGEAGQAERIEPVHATGDRNEYGDINMTVHVSGGDPRQVTNAIREALRSANLRRALGRGI